MTLNPLPLLNAGLKTAGAFLGGIQTYLIVGAATLAIGAAGGAYAGWRWEQGAINKLKLADAQAQTQAVQAKADSDARQAKVLVAAASDEAYFRGKMDGTRIILKAEIPTYVTQAQDDRVCVTVGLYRVLRAAESGVTPGSLGLAAGQSNDDCADITASALAGEVAPVLEDGFQNAEQLNSLIKTVKDIHDVVGPRPPQ